MQYSKMIKEKYSFYSENIPVNISIESNKDEFVLMYNVNISQISANTELVLDKIRDELVNKVKLGIADITDPKKMEFVKGKFEETIIYLIEKYFPDISEDTKKFFTSYLMHKSFGLGKIEVILDDKNLEEIVVNNADEPIWVYHRKHGWLKTNITLGSEDLIKHYSALIARKVGRSITMLTPLLDAHLDTGDRVNATLFPITTKGNTITIRKFSEKPITITDMLKSKTISLSAASLVWTAVQYELSTLISGGTASGKCLTGDSEILLPHKRMKIKELVENEIKNNKSRKIDDGFIADSNLEVLSFNPKTLKIEKKKIENVWKRKSPEYLLKIRTRSGRVITCTEEHPFFVLDSEIKQVRADKLSDNNYISVPRYLPLDKNEAIFNLDSLKPSLVFEDNKDFLLVRLSNNSKITKIPKKLSEELARLVGYIIGDGHIDKKLGCVKFFSEEDEVLKDYMSCANNVFGIETKIKKYKDKCRQVDISNKIIAKYLCNILKIPKGKKSDIVAVPDYLLFSEKKYLKEFIKALFECDCYVDKIRSSLEFTTKSEQLAYDLSLALERFGIISRIRRTFKRATNSNHKGDRYYDIGFGGKVLYNFHNEIGLISKRKSKKIIDSIKPVFSTNVDMIPNINNHIKYLKESLNLYEKDIKGNLSREAISRYMCNIRTPSRDSLTAVINTIGKRIPDFVDDQEIPFVFNFLKNLSSSDVLWDPVISIEKIKSEDEWVYDLTVEDNHTFIANNVIAHNTSILGVVSNFFPPNQRIISIEDSVLPKSKILYKEKGIIKKSTIGELVDKQISKNKIELIDGTEVSENKGNIEIFSMDDNGKIKLKKPSNFIRHKVNKKILDISLASGRKISVTKDHSLFSLINNEIKEINSSKLNKGSFIATPRKLEYVGNRVIFDISEYIENFEGCFIIGEPVKKIIQNLNNKIISKSNLQHYRRKNMIPVRLFEKYMDLITEEDKKQICIISKTNSYSKRLELPLIMEVDGLLACLCGMWLADGCYGKNSVLISVPEEECRNKINEFLSRFNTSYKIHSDDVTIMMNSKLLRIFFEKVLNLKGNAYTKETPLWVYNLDDLKLSEFIKGYFSGDGTVKKYEISVSSSSMELLEDIQTLLLRYEIPLRISRNLKHDKTYEARISTVKFLKQYNLHIRFLQKYKNVKLNSIINKKDHDISDIIPLSKDICLELKYLLEKGIKKVVNSKRAFWSWHRSLLRSNIGRGRLTNLLKLSNLDNILFIENPLLNKVLKLANNDIFWDRVVNIEERDYNGWVYDLSVPETENFICENIIAHNTRELVLSKHLQWIPMVTREPNVEGKGEVSMLDLTVNSLRMRPDRIVVGEIRKKREAEVLFEAMHTGHSVYATIHANDSEETITRLTNPPIDISKTLIPAISMLLIMYRNRRTGIRRVFQVSEILKDGNPNVLMQHDMTQDRLLNANQSMRLLPELEMQTGLSSQEINQELRDKAEILKWLVAKDVNDVNGIGKVVANYYTNKEGLMKFIRK